MTPKEFFFLFFKPGPHYTYVQYVFIQHTIIIEDNALMFYLDIKINILLKCIQGLEDGLT